MAKNRGTSANQARNPNSKRGNINTSKNPLAADKVKDCQFFGEETRFFTSNGLYWIVYHITKGQFSFWPIKNISSITLKRYVSAGASRGKLSWMPWGTGLFPLKRSGGRSGWERETAGQKGVGPISKKWSRTTKRVLWPLTINPQIWTDIIQEKDYTASDL